MTKGVRVTGGPGDDFIRDPPQRATRVDLENPVLAEHLYELYARWRASEPVRRGPLGEWYLTRYDDVAMVLGDPARFRSNLEGTRLFEELIDQLRGDAADPVRNVVTDASLLRLDPPDHTRLRRLASKAFTPRAVERLRPRIEQIVGELLDRVDSGSLELMREFAYPLPVTVIAELLGLPALDGELLGRWSRALLIDSPGLGIDDPELLARSRQANRELDAYLRGVVAARRRAPREDLISALVAVEEEGDRLTERELISLLRAVAHRRPRDHGQPARQRDAGAASPPGASGGGCGTSHR